VTAPTRAPRRFVRPARPACAAGLGQLLWLVTRGGPIAHVGQAEPRPLAKIGPSLFLRFSHFSKTFIRLNIPEIPLTSKICSNS
jgi:hypothetical protein